jgi:hypothetical protein
LVQLLLVSVNRGNVGEKYRIAAASLRYKSPVRRERDLEVEDVRSIALVEDEEYLGKVTVTFPGLDRNDLIDAGLEEGEVLVVHSSSR